MNKDIQVGTIIKIDTAKKVITFKVEKIEIRHNQNQFGEWNTRIIGKHADHTSGDITPNFDIGIDDLVSSLKRYISGNKVEFQQPEEE